MEKEMTVCIESSHRIPEAEEEHIILETVGQLRKKAGSLVLRYREEMENTHATLVFGRDGIKMIRSGTYRCVMLFRPAARSECPYHTPYGSLRLCIETQDVFCDMTEDGGRVEWRYTMESDGRTLGDYRIGVHVCPLTGKE